MTRVYVVVEGQTEEAFVGGPLAEALWPKRVLLTPILLGVPGHKGGNTKYARVQKDLLRQLKSDKDAYCSTMLDFYRLGSGFPGTPLPPHIGNLAKAERIEQAVKADICERIPDFRPDVRLIPYLSLHEYEGLLFSDPASFAKAIHQDDLAPRFHKIRDSFATPEDINDSPDTAPSKRLLQLYPGYGKVLDGTLAAGAVGVANMRRECPHFRAWVEQLENLHPL